MKRLKVGRVFLNPGATEDLNYIIDELKQSGPFLRGGPSDLVSFIISEFKAKYFEKEKAVLKKQFFDGKSRLIDQIKKAKSQEEIDGLLEERRKERLKEKKNGRSKAKSQPLDPQENEVNS